MQVGFAKAEQRDAATNARITDALAETNAAMQVGFAKAEQRDAATNARITDALAETNAAMQVGFAKAEQRDAATRAELTVAMQAGFTRMDRRLAWYLVTVAALLVGFALAVWIPLVGALRQQSSHAPPEPAAATAQPDAPGIALLAGPGARG